MKIKVNDDFELENIDELIVVLGFKKFATECIDKSVFENMSEDGKNCLAEVFVDLMFSCEAEDMIDVIEKVAAAINFGYSAGMRYANKKFC